MRRQTRQHRHKAIDPHTPEPRAISALAPSHPARPSTPCCVATCNAPIPTQLTPARTEQLAIHTHTCTHHIRTSSQAQGTPISRLCDDSGRFTVCPCKPPSAPLLLRHLCAAMYMTSHSPPVFSLTLCLFIDVIVCRHHSSHVRLSRLCYPTLGLQLRHSLRPCRTRTGCCCCACWNRVWCSAGRWAPNCGQA